MMIAEMSRLNGRMLATVEFTVIMLLATCFAIQPAFAGTGVYDDSIADEVAVESRYAKLDLCDASGAPIGGPMFADAEVDYENGTLSETVLVEGTLTLVLYNGFGIPCDFLVRHDAEFASGDDAIPLKVAITTAPSAPPSGSFVPLHANPDPDGFGDVVSASVDGVSIYHIHIRTGEGEMRLTGPQNVSLSFTAVFDDGTALVMSDDNSLKLGLSGRVEPSDDATGRDFDIVEGSEEHSGVSYPTAEIHYGDTESAIGAANTVSHFSIESGSSFCIEYVVNGNPNVSFTFTVSGYGTYSVKPHSAQQEIGFIGMKNGGLKMYSTLEALISDDAWIEGGSAEGFSLTVSGKLKNSQDVAKAILVFNTGVSS